MLNAKDKLLKLIKSKAGSLISGIMAVNIMLAIIALMKDILTAHYLGTTAEADALLLAYFIPDNIGNILFAAAIGTACVPVFAKLSVLEEEERLNNCIRNINYSMFFLAILLFIAFYLMRYHIISFLGEGLLPEIKELFLDLYIIVLPTVLIFPTFSIGSAVLQIYNRFIVVAMAPVLSNVPFIGVVLYTIYNNTPISKGVYGLAFSLTGGVLVMFILIWCSLAIVKGDKFKAIFAIHSNITNEELKDIKDILLIFIQYFLIILSTQSVLYVERYLASFLQTGSIAGLNYAYRIALFPLWIFITAISAVILPTLSRYSGLGRKKEIEDTVSKAFYLSLIITIPMAIIVFSQRIPIITILLKRGAFDERSLQITAAILAGYSLAIIGQAILHIGLRVFLALGKLFLTMLLCFAAALFTVLMDIYLVQKIGSAGIGYGAAIGASANAVAIIYVLKKYIDLNVSREIKLIIKILIANIPVLLISVLGSAVWSDFFQNKEFLGHFGYMFIVLFLSFTTYMISLWRLKVI